MKIKNVYKQRRRVVESNIIVPKGTIQFSKSDWRDAYIQSALGIIAKWDNENPVDIQNALQQKIDEKTVKMYDKSPLLFDTIRMNAVETEVFNRLWMIELDQMTAAMIGKQSLPRPLADVVPGSPIYSKAIFQKLITYIKSEHVQFFPMRDVIDSKHLVSPRIVEIPSLVEKSYDNIDTAAATPDGNFIFNTLFNQRLIDWAFIKGTKGTSKKYVSQGGDIPDEYVYIEFVIMHEFMHYTYGDFHYGKEIFEIEKKRGVFQIINYVGDFRTNYILVKKGFAQLPMGLFNDDINRDRQLTYQEMYDIVKEELEKLKDEDEGEGEGEEGEGEEGEGEEGEGDEGEGEGGEPKKGKGKGKSVKDMLDELANDDHDELNNEAEKQAKEDEKKRKKPKTLEEIFNEIDKKSESVENKVNDTNTTKAPKKKGEGGEPGEGEAKSGNDFGGHRSGQSHHDAAFDYDKVKPTYSWRKILQLLVSSTENVQVDDTYSKLHKRAITSIDAVKKTGAGMVKPAEIETYTYAPSLVFVVDSSGSMISMMPQVYANLLKLLKSNPDMTDLNFYLIKYSDTYKTYLCNMNANTYQRVTIGDIEDLEPDEDGLGGGGSLKTLFSTTMNGGTYFSDKLVNHVKHFSDLGYNVIMFSDSDIIGGENFTNYKKLFIHARQKLFTILDNEQTYKSIITRVTGSTKYVSHF